MNRLERGNRRGRFFLSLKSMLVSPSSQDSSLERKQEVLLLLQRMCDGCFTPMQSFLLHEGIRNQHSSNLLREVG